MVSTRNWAKLPPLPFGRLTRVLFGIGTLASLNYIGVDSLGATGTSVLVFLGVSFLVGGVFANPGCEITALVNVLLPRRRRMHFP